MKEDIFRGKGVEISLENRDDFLKVKETLTRIGIASSVSNTLYQSCHILHKRGRYVIVHFKELFEMDGKFTDITDEDIERRNAIAFLLEKWNLLKIIDNDFDRKNVNTNNVKIISHAEKFNWELKSKYSVGTKGK
jgi:hypothetical protein